LQPNRAGERVHVRVGERAHVVGHADLLERHAVHGRS
jgi:hypothetical protein